MNALLLLEVYGLDALLIALCAYLFWLEYRANSLAAFFWVTLLGIYAVPALLDPTLDWAPLVGTGRPLALAGNPVTLEGTLFAVSFSVVYLVVRRFTLRNETTPLINLKDDLTSLSAADVVAKRFAYLLAAAALLGAISGFYSLYVVMGVSGISESGYSLFRLNADPTFVRPAFYLLAASSGGVFVAWRTKKWSAVAVIVTATLGYFLLSFARQILMFMAAPFALYVLYTKQTTSWRLSLIGGAVLGYYFTIFLLFLRYKGSNTDALEALFNGDLFQDFMPRASEEGGELTLRYVYYYIMDNKEVSSVVMPGQTYLRLAMIFIPSDYAMGLKPDLLDHTLWYAVFTDPGYRNVEGGSLHALIFGDSFANFGWFGVLLGGFWALAAKASSVVLARLPKVLRVALYAPLGFGIMAVARGAVYNACAYVVWSSLILGGIYLLAANLRVRNALPVRGLGVARERRDVSAG